VSPQRSPLDQGVSQTQTVLYIKVLINAFDKKESRILLVKLTPTLRANRILI
jgi:hypothetical protein